MTVLELGGFQLGALVNIQVTTGTVPVPLMTSGEVTAVDVEYGPDGNLTVVRGLDASHRLMRGTNTMAYPEMMASDVVEMLTSTAVIPPGEIIPTRHALRVAHAGQRQRLGLHPAAGGAGKLRRLRRRPGVVQLLPLPPPGGGRTAGDEPGRASHRHPARDGQEPHSSPGTVSAAEQVPEVNVLGYDPLLAAPVVGHDAGDPLVLAEPRPGDPTHRGGGRVRSLAVLRFEPALRQRRLRP